MGLYLLLHLFKFYVINFCFAKISISAFDLIYCKLLILIWIQVLFLTFWVFFFLYNTSNIFVNHLQQLFIKNVTMAIHVNGMAALVHTRKPATKAKCHFRWKNTISKHIRSDNNSLAINENFESAPLTSVFSDYLGLFWNLKKNNREVEQNILQLL